ncbi:MAG TPA: sigma-54 dependent transcriptional regulator [Dissulfurispiraceae bacterium]|nr:sigma-54 dependent transcriptional regulator [Dissulfurispiraceae bacterium]
MGKVLIIDDDDDLRGVVGDILKDEGFETAEARDGNTAFAVFKKETPDAVLLDLRMPGLGGIEVMQKMKKLDPHLPVIIMTAHGDIPTAVDAIRNGAYDFTVKPPDYNKLIITLKRAVERRKLECDVDRMSAALDASLEQMFGRSAGMRDVISQITQVADTNLSVVIQGETGTGKSYIAGAIHNVGKRAKKPFVRVDMGLIPDTLFESELFGYRKGAFTGADRNKAGYFENANSGTIFIDEIENIPLYIQGKLLSVLDERQIYPLGSTTPVSIDVRVVAATNSDIRGCVIRNTFRQDLFYRIGEFIINVPPLRERADDIPFFVDKFIMEASSELDRQISEITGEALDLMMRHVWSGNVRELKNVVRKAVLMAPGDVIDRRTVAPLLAGGKAEEREFPLSIKEAMKEVEKANIREALRRTGGNKTKAAELLQISYKNLFDKIKVYGLE